MPRNSRDCLLEHLRHAALLGSGERRSDGQLLEQFIAERDETAFALLLRKHGPMVWSVCRRVLGNNPDADDAFQAAFLVLVRKASSVRPREAVGNWLYGVAYRTALEARGRIARRRAKEQALQDVPMANKSEEPWQELRPILDRELSRLADKYRLPIVLCDLEGRSRKEVAQQLAIPEGTLSSRLNTARKKLAARLARYGFTLSAVALAALLTERAAMASLAPSLLSATTKAALTIATSPAAATGVVSATVSTLMEGVLKTMFFAKIKTAALVLGTLAALGLGTSGVYYQTRAGAADSPRETQKDQTKNNREPERSADDWKRIVEDLKNQLSAERDKARKLQSETAGLRAEIESMKKEALASQQRFPVPPEHLEAIKKAKAEQERLVKEHQKRFEALRKKQLELLEMQRQQFNNEINPKADQKPASADKLDQILERLERLDKRLERLEKGRK